MGGIFQELPSVKFSALEGDSKGVISLKQNLIVGDIPYQ